MEFHPRNQIFTSGLIYSFCFAAGYVFACKPEYAYSLIAMAVLLLIWGGFFLFLFKPVPDMNFAESPEDRYQNVNVSKSLRGRGKAEALHGHAMDEAKGSDATNDNWAMCLWLLWWGLIICFLFYIGLVPSLLIVLILVIAAK